MAARQPATAEQTRARRGRTVPQLRATRDVERGYRKHPYRRNTSSTDTRDPRKAQLGWRFCRRGKPTAVAHSRLGKCVENDGCKTLSILRFGVSHERSRYREYRAECR